MPRPLPSCGEGWSLKATVALPGAGEVAMEYNPASARHTAAGAASSSHRMCAGPRCWSFRRCRREDAATCCLVQASFRGMKVRSEVRRMMAVAASRAEKCQTGWGQAVPTIRRCFRRARSRQNTRRKWMRNVGRGNAERERKKQGERPGGDAESSSLMRTTALDQARSGPNSVFGSSNKSGSKLRWLQWTR